MMVGKAWLADSLAAPPAASRLKCITWSPSLPDGVVELCLQDLVPQPIDSLQKHSRRRPRRGGRSRSERRKLAKLKVRAGDGSGDAEDWIRQAALLGIARADSRHREAGLWALDTYNGNAMATAQLYLQDTAADAVCLQESKVLAADVPSAQRMAKGARWSLALEPARLTDEGGGASGGTGVAARSFLGLAEVEDLPDMEELHSRVKVAHLRAVCKGGIFLVSAYLWCSEGLSARNLALLQALAQVILQLHGPWVFAADCNFPPGTLEKSGWISLVKGHLVCTRSATCRAVEDDYFVVDRRLRRAVVGVALVHDTGAKPHFAVRMWLKGKPRRDTSRVMRAPP